MAAKRKIADPNAFVSYLRVSTEEQAESGLGLEAQREKIKQECDKRGWHIVHEFLDPGVSGGLSVKERPNLGAALEMLERRDAGGLIVAKLDRLSRSTEDASMLVGRSIRERWTLVSCDMALDTSTPSGQAMANMMAVFAELEKRMIGQRTSDALRAKRAQGASLGRPDRTPSSYVELIVNLKLYGLGVRAIATRLNEEGIPTSQGGAKWHPSSVKAVLRRTDAQKMLSQLSV